MSESSKVAFLNQPMHVMARQGEAFSAGILDTLRRWVHSRRRETVRATAGNIFVLSPEPSSQWKIVVLAYPKLERHGVFANVCALETGTSGLIAERFAPLAMAEWVPAAVEVRLDDVVPRFFQVYIDAHAETEDPHGGEGLAAARPNAFMDTLDVNARRWGSSQARSQFKRLLDDARLQPQIVERGDDDLVVVSRSYLEELEDPSSARAMSQHFRGGGLLVGDMPGRRRRPLEPLRTLPELREP